MSGPPTLSSFEHGEEFYNETIWQKMLRRVKEEPLIPIGFAATCYAFYQASRSVRSGTPYRTNRMFRYRIYGQAFTIVAMVAGSFYYNADRILRKEFEAVKVEREAKERNEAWIKELEFREQEEKVQQKRSNSERERQRRSSAKEKGNQNANRNEGVLERVTGGKVLQELNKVVQDTKDVVKDVVNTQKVADNVVDTKEVAKNVAQDTKEVVKDFVDTKIGK